MQPKNVFENSELNRRVKDMLRRIATQFQCEVFFMASEETTTKRAEKEVRKLR